MQELALHWYTLLGSLNATMALPLRELAQTINLPLVSAILFGLIGATSPCQLTTNASAAAFLARDSGGSGKMARETASFVAGKVVVYTLLGVIASVAGQQLAQTSIPLAALARKILGPVMILLGLHLLRLLPVRFAAGTSVSGWLEARAGRSSAGAFALGSSFAFAFCPTLFLLFFGLTIPMMWSSPGVGTLYPAAFALGTVLPLLVVMGLVGLGLGSVRSLSRGLRSLSPYLPLAAGLILLLAGLNDTLVYWLL